MSEPLSLLVLGASLYQLPAIRAARAAGFIVLTLDNIPDNPGHLEADISFDISTTAREEVLAVARDEDVAGVVAVATDVAVPTAAFVAETLHLPGVPLSSAEIVCHKSQFRDFLRKEGLPTPDAAVLAPEQTEPPFVLPEEAGSQTWIIKPDASSGSKGTRMIQTKGAFARALPEARTFSLNDKVVLEAFIEGRQGTVEGVLQDGALAFSLILDRQTARPPFVVTTGHHVPTHFHADEQTQILAAITDVLGRLKITQGPFDCDFVFGDDGKVYLLEISPRVGGNAIADLLQAACSFDIVEVAVKMACGEPVELPQEPVVTPSAVLLLGVEQEGSLSFDKEEAEALKALPWVRSFSMDKQWGEPVQPFINGRHRVGMCLLQADDRDTLEQRVQAFKSRLKLTTT